MGADLVMQQGLDAVRPGSGGFGDEQPAERHHQFGDIVRPRCEPGSLDTRHGYRSNSAPAATANAPAVPRSGAGESGLGWSRAAPPRRRREAGRSLRKAAATRTRTVSSPTSKAVICLLSRLASPGRVCAAQGRLRSRSRGCRGHAAPGPVFWQFQRVRAVGTVPKSLRSKSAHASCRIDRCDVDQQVQAALDLGEAGVDFERQVQRPWVADVTCRETTTNLLSNLPNEALCR